MKKISKKKESGESEVILSLKNQLSRALADYDNLTKRTETEKEGWFKFSTMRIIRELLPILDNLENMQKHLNDQGLSITIVEFKKVLNEEGYSEILPQVGEDFDENKMEALGIVEGGEEGKIAEVVLSGWVTGEGQIVRHAKVNVFKKAVN